MSGSTTGRRLLKTILPVLIATVVLAQAAAATAAAPTLTVGPTNAPTSGMNSFPFGTSMTWTPFAGFIYKNLPPFELRQGDYIAFDTQAVNNTGIQRNVAMSPTTANGGDAAAGTFVSMVSFAQPAATPNGNTIAGDYDLRWTNEATTPFKFPGGGLIIRFSQPVPADATFTANLKGVDATDSSGFFVKRFVADPDGGPAYNSEDITAIGEFRLTFNRLCRGQTATIVGSAGNDQLQGTAGADVVFSSGGNDTIAALGGDDIVCGGEGKDTVKGGAGKDILSGEDGKDRLKGGGGKDRLVGGAGKDTLIGGAAKDKLVGGPGKDKQTQ